MTFSRCPPALRPSSVAHYYLDHFRLPPELPGGECRSRETRNRSEDPRRTQTGPSPRMTTRVQTPTPRCRTSGRADEPETNQPRVHARPAPPRSRHIVLPRAPAAPTV